MKNIELKDFSGGITDFTYNSDPKYFKEADNFLIERDRTVYSRHGIGLYDSNNAQIPQGSERIPRLDTLGDGIVAFSGPWINLFLNSSLSIAQTPNGNLALNNANFSTIHDSAKWQDQLFIVDNAFSSPIKVFIDGFGVLKAVQAGLPEIVNSITLTPSIAETSSYIYAFNYKYTYTVGAETLVSYGPVTYSQITNGPDFSLGESITISGIPVLSSGTGAIYDDANIVKQIHRTEDGGLTYYLVAEIPNATTGYVDTTTNELLVNNQVIYNQATNAVYSEPIKSKYIEIINNIAWYGNCYDSASFPNRVYQSIPSIPDAVPRDNYIEFDEEVTGIGSFDIYPIIFTKSKVYRLEGFIDSFGSGVIIKKVIADAVGGISNNSIIKTSTGLYWASADGFYRTDAFRASKISTQIDYRYKVISSSDSKREKIYATYDQINKRIIWACQKSQSDNDIMFVFDELFDAFTTVSALKTTQPASILYKDNCIVIGDSRGILFCLSEKHKSDLVFDVLASPSEWKTTPILYNLVHIDYDFGSFDINKWVTRISVFGKQQNPVDFIVSSFNNGSNKESFTYPVKYTQGMAWNDSGYEWGEEQLTWGGDPNFMYISRRFRCGKMRLRHKSFKIQNTNAIIKCSSENNSMTELIIDQSIKTASSQDIQLVSFSSDENGYFLEISNVLYEIENATSDTLSLKDPDNSLVSGVYQFKIVGIPKNQILHIDGIVYSFTDQDNDISWYQGGAKE